MIKMTPMSKQLIKLVVALLTVLTIVWMLVDTLFDRMFPEKINEHSIYATVVNTGNCTRNQCAAEVVLANGSTQFIQLSEPVMVGTPVYVKCWEQLPEPTTTWCNALWRTSRDGVPASSNVTN